MVAQLENFEKLQQLFMETMQGAGENYKKPEVTESTQQDDIKFQARSSFKDGLFSDIQSRKYWYPNMTKSEISEVKSLADHEANTTDNYLGIDAKWLYNNQKGHKYFALYSTVDVQGTTLLYACKGEKADLEQAWLTEEVRQGGSLNEDSNRGTGSPVGILERIEHATSRQTLRTSRSGGARSDNRNAAVYSKNQGKRLNAAFKNCLKNLAEVQKRYGVDDHYMFATDLGDIKTAQRIDKLAEARTYQDVYKTS